MKKFIIIAVLVISWLFSLNKANNVFADWWQRPEVRPTQPSEERSLPTLAPTTVPSQPTVAPTNPPTGGTPSTGGGSSGSEGNACDPGKPFVGPYCGWSPNVNNSGGSSEQPRVGGPQVLGLSNTSSGNLSVSDIMILAGILCLAVYARSKIAVDNKLH